MRYLWGNLRSDIERSFYGPSFAIAVAGVVLSMLMGCTSELQYFKGQSMDVLTFFGMTHSFGFAQMLPVFCALPFATCFCTDWNHMYIKACCVRGSPGAYAASKVALSAFTGSIAIAFGQIIYLWILSLAMPIYNPDIEKNFSVPVFNDLVSNGSYVPLYFLYRILIWAAFFALFAVIALWISTFIPNVFVVLSTPVIIYFLVTTIDSSILGMVSEKSAYRYISFNTLYNANLNMGDDLKSLLYPIGFCILLIAIFGVMAGINMKRRIQHA